MPRVMKGELKLKLQLMCGDEIAMGPGKAKLLREIERVGSISGAGRALGMSYRRAWLLVDTMNRCFHDPLVEARPGSGSQAGARLTTTGQRVVKSYERLVAAATSGAAGPYLEALQHDLRQAPVVPK